MSKKKSVSRGKAAAGAASKTKTVSTRKKSVRVAASPGRKIVKKKARQKPRTAKAAGQAAAVKKTVRKPRLKLPKSLGRPTLPGEARLDLVFQKDYQAREIFVFLGVHTIRELEQFSAEDIIERLTGPMVQTVERIRKALAINNRCLASDRDFALQFQKQWKSGRK